MPERILPSQTCRGSSETASPTPPPHLPPRSPTSGCADGQPSSRDVARAAPWRSPPGERIEHVVHTAVSPRLAMVSAYPPLRVPRSLVPHPAMPANHHVHATARVQLNPHHSLISTLSLFSLFLVAPLGPSRKLESASWRMMGLVRRRRPLPVQIVSSTAVVTGA